MRITTNTIAEAQVPAEELKSGEIGKIVKVDARWPDGRSCSNGYLLRTSKGGIGLAPAYHVPVGVGEPDLQYIDVVRMPKGFKLTLEVE